MVPTSDFEEQLASKFREIKMRIATDLGLGDPASLSEAALSNLHDEAVDAIAQWQETVEMEVRPADPKTPLQTLLRQYCEIEDSLLDHLDSIHLPDEQDPFFGDDTDKDAGR